MDIRLVYSVIARASMHSSSHPLDNCSKLFCILALPIIILVSCKPLIRSPIHLKWVEPDLSFSLTHSTIFVPSAYRSKRLLILIPWNTAAESIRKVSCAVSGTSHCRTPEMTYEINLGNVTGLILYFLSPLDRIAMHVVIGVVDL